VTKHKKPKFYVVWEGRRPGVYTNWTEAEEQIHGYAGARHRAYPTRADAEAAFAHPYVPLRQSIPAAVSAPSPPSAIDWTAIAVDAACSGVPGPMEYRGVDMANGKELFRVGPLEDGTNNIGEFLAIVHALALLKKQDRPGVRIYSDSVTALSWLRAKKCRTKQPRTERNGHIFELIARAEAWLSANPVTNPVTKWETESWGEIPADFGRK
jgi:ribonuclease HI